MQKQQLIFAFWRRPKNRKKKERKKNPTGKSFVLIGITKYTGTAWICLWEDDLWKDSTAIGSPPECRYIRINIWIAAFFFKIKNNINFVCEFWDHCIYESPHTSSMAAWRWFNMARRGTQHWSLPTVWGKVSSRLALYAGKPLSPFYDFEFLFSVCLSFSFTSFCLTVIFVYTVLFLFPSKKRLMTAFDISFYYFLGVFCCLCSFQIYIWFFFFVSSFKPQKIILHMIKTPSRFQNNQQLHSTKM